MTELIAVDVGGTNARFARATLDDNGVPTLLEVKKFGTNDFSSFAEAWRAYARSEDKPLPPNASCAFAAAVSGEIVKLTNSNWTFRPDRLAHDLGVENLVLVNDFEAIGHAVPRLPISELPLLFGPDHALPQDGIVSVLGPGTGLGVCMVAFHKGVPHVIATEGGHIDFAPIDLVETKIRDYLRKRLTRVSAERFVSGPGLNNIYEAMAAINGEEIRIVEDPELWERAIEDGGSLARSALERFNLVYGSYAGDVALMQGAHSVVLCGGLTIRERECLERSGFHGRFTAKGRHESLMRNIPVRLATHDNIGLFGAAAAFGAKMR